MKFIWIIFVLLKFYHANLFPVFIGPHTSNQFQNVVKSDDKSTSENLKGEEVEEVNEIEVSEVDREWLTMYSRRCGYHN